MGKLKTCNIRQQAGYTTDIKCVYNNLTYRFSLIKKMLKFP